MFNTCILYTACSKELQLQASGRYRAMEDGGKRKPVWRPITPVVLFQIVLQCKCLYVSRSISFLAAFSPISI